jgi:D-beta-D-heptose 7-phosphate kinase/D-beta-D-heptose 1-phosphate adenosyltransferase
VVDIKRETYHLGGAANVAHNISALGGRAFLCGRIGNDSSGKELLNLLKEKDIDASGVFVCPESITTVKTRVIAHSQQVVRFDREVRTPLKDRILAQVVNFLESVEKPDLIIVSDYAKGVITDVLMDKVKIISKQMNIPLVVDPKVSNKHLYRGVTVLTPNQSEAVQMAGYSATNSEADLATVASAIIKELECKFLLVTRGSEGMTLFDDDCKPIHIPACARKVFDVTGAGDTVVALLALGMVAGLSIHEAAYLANVAAGFVVGEVGTAVITPQQLRALLNDDQLEFRYERP